MPAETVSRAEVVRAKQRFSIIGNSEALNSAIERAVKVAPIDLSVLVTGESGSGKEFFPKIIHQYGARKHKKYIAVNCGAIPEGTIDSELFGHEKGSFTGALSDRKGYFEEADGGTIFLDEVAELPLTTQARLLRVLETGEFLKVGSSKVQKTDIRVVAATNADLLKAVRAGKFREDLYYRLSTVIIQVPNLHDRGDDVLLLARKFASNFSERYMTAPIRFSEEAGELLLAYRWPGNVRQLKNIVEQLALFDSGETITRRRLIEVMPHPADTNLQVSAENHSYENEREHLWQALLTLKKEVEALRLQLSERGDVTDHHSYTPMRSIIKLDDPAFEPLSADILSEGSEKQQIIDALRRCKGSKREAAKMLEMSERTLYRRLHELDITPDKYS